MKSFGIILSILLLVIGINSIYDLNKDSNRKQQIKYDLNKLSNIKYGLLNVHEWKRKVAALLNTKINEFKISGVDKSNLKKIIADVLHSGIEEIDDFIKEQQGEGNIAKRFLRRKVYNTLFDSDAFHLKVPELSNALLDAINKDNNKEKLIAFLTVETEKLMGKDVKKEDVKSIKKIMLKYNAQDLSSCKESMHKEINDLRKNIKHSVLVIFMCFLMCFLLWFFIPVQKRGFSQFSIIVFFCILVLVGGIIHPMIDIDARITSLDFEIMGNKVSFDEQSLFFQSKSIADVAILLIQEEDINSFGVGVLIIVFSILFPFIKILLSLFVFAQKKIPTNVVLRFFIFKSAKWSMADVFIVAIFMSYIGFKSVLKSQIETIGSKNDTVSVIATDYTALQEGFPLFLLFVIGSMILSELLKTTLYKNNQII